MSKVISFSMAMLLVLINVVGPTMPTDIMVDPQQQEDSVEQPMLLEEDSGDDLDQELLNQEPTDGISIPPVEGEPPVSDEDDLVPIDEPIEDANAPPADDEPVSDDEAPAIDEDTLAGDEAPISEEEPVTEDEAPAVEEAPVIEDETPITEEELVAEDEAPVVEDDDPVVEEELVDEDETTPVADEEQPTIEVSNSAKVEGTPEGDDSLISPSAVNPNPGECGGVDQEPCPGGGDEEVIVAVTIKPRKHIYPGDIGFILPGAAVTIRDDTNAVLGDFISDESGWVQVNLTSGKTYTVDITAEWTLGVTGYQITPTPNTTEIFIPVQTIQGTYVINVVNKYTGDVLPGATINLYDASPERFIATGTTNSAGIWTSPDVPLGKSFRADVYMSGFTSTAVTTLHSSQGQVVTVELEPRSIGSVDMLIIDSVTGEPVVGAWVLVMDSTNWDWLSEGHTSASGSFITSGLPDRDFVLVIESQHYMYYESTFHHPGEQQLVIELQPYVDSQITMTIIDADTGLPIPDAYISFNSNSDIVASAHGRSNASGVWVTPVLPAYSYTVHVYADGYWQDEFWLQLHSSTMQHTVELSEIEDRGRLYLQVTDERLNPISGVTIVVWKDLAIVGIGTTDRNGEWATGTFDWGTYRFEFTHPRYRPMSKLVFTAGGDDYVNFEMAHRNAVRFRFRIICSTCGIYSDPNAFGPGITAGLSTSAGLTPLMFQTENGPEPLVGATVQLLDPNTLEVMFETVSDAEGWVDFDEVWEGDYILKVSAVGLDDYTQSITIGETSEFELIIDLSDDTNPNPGDGDDDDTPANPNPDDGDDDDTPTNPNPGDGDGDDNTPNNPVPGDGDSDDIPTNPNPGDGDGDDTPTNPVPGDGDDDDTPTNPVPGADDDSDTPTNPVPGEDDDSDTSTNPASDDGDEDSTSGNSGGAVTTPGEDNAEATTGSTGNEVAQASNSGTSDTTGQSQSGSVSQLPDTGTGAHQSGMSTTAIMLLAGLLLLSAAILRRRA